MARETVCMYTKPAAFGDWNQREGEGGGKGKEGEREGKMKLENLFFKSIYMYMYHCFLKSLLASA